MNIEHLRKQAKNLQSIFPELVATSGPKLTLASARAALARTHGFPSWSAAVAKACFGTIGGYGNRFDNRRRDPEGLRVRRRRRNPAPGRA